MWQFAEACRGLKDACLELGIPVTGGNVSLYNQTGETAILPTPVVAVLGVIDDVTPAYADRLRGRGRAVFLLGETREELSGSEWAHVVHGHLGGLPAARRPGRRAACWPSCCSTPPATGWSPAAHDLSDGGLAQALVESCLRHGVGVRVSLPDGLTRSSALFASRPPARSWRSPPEQEERFAALCARAWPRARPLGVTEGTGPEAVLDVAGPVHPAPRRDPAGLVRDPPRRARLSRVWGRSDRFAALRRICP